MAFLARERATLDELLPCLDDKLVHYGLMELEQPGNAGLSLFKAAGGTGMLVPAEHGGAGASALDAVRCTRAIGARSPSLAIAATMHNFSVASLVALADRSDGPEWMLVDAIANDGLLVSSAFAEGKTGQHILRPAMRADRHGRCWVVSGSKKPCSLSRSMDLITTSVALDDGGLGVALIPAAQTGISVHPFWNSLVLTGAESDEVVLDRVEVPDELMVRVNGADDELQQVGMAWFSLLVGAAYLGAASALAERLLTDRRGTPDVRSEVCWSLDTAMLALERAALELDAGHTDLPMALSVRYSTQQTIARITATAVEALGGMAFIGSPDIAYLAATTHAVAFHPPSRSSVADAFDEYFTGGRLWLR